MVLCYIFWECLVLFLYNQRKNHDEVKNRLRFYSNLEWKYVYQSSLNFFEAFHVNAQLYIPGTSSIIYLTARNAFFCFWRIIRRMQQCALFTNRCCIYTYLLAWKYNCVSKSNTFVYVYLIGNMRNNWNVKETVIDFNTAWAINT